MSADDKEPYFDGPHLSTASSQAPCNSIVDQRQLGHVQYSTVTSSQVHNHISNPTSMPFFYNPNQYGAPPASWEPGPSSSLQDNQQIPKLNGHSQHHAIGNHTEQSSSSASSSHQNSPAKSNYYANMQQAPQEIDLETMESIDLSAPGTSTSQQPLPAQQLSAVDGPTQMYNALPNSFMPPDALQQEPMAQYMAPQQIDLAYPQPEGLQMPFAENAQWNEGQLPQQNQSFGSYMNMANNSNPEQMPVGIQLQQQQPVMFEPSSDAGAIQAPVLPGVEPVVLGEPPVGEPPQQEDPLDAGIVREPNFSSDHLHRSYTPNDRRSFDDILHSQGTWQRPVQYNEAYDVNQLAYNAQDDEDPAENDDGAVPVADAEHLEPRAAYDQPMNDFDNPERNAEHSAPVEDAALQMQALNISSPDNDEDHDADDDLSEDNNQVEPNAVYQEKVETYIAEPDADSQNLPNISEPVQFDPNAQEEADESEPPSQHEEINPESEAEKPNEISLHPQNQFSGGSYETSALPPSMVQPFMVDPQQSQTKRPTIPTIPTTDVTPLENQPTSSQTQRLANAFGALANSVPESQHSGSNPLLEQTLKPVAMEAGGRTILEQHVRNHSISSNSSHRSAASHHSSSKPPVVEPPPLNIRSLPGNSEASTSQNVALETHTMHSSYVSVQSRTQQPAPVQLLTPSVSTGPAEVQPPDVVPPPSGAAPQSLHSQMVVGRSTTNQASPVPPLPASMSQQHSYNDMHASAVHRNQIVVDSSMYYDNQGHPSSRSTGPPSAVQRGYSAGAMPNLRPNPRVENSQQPVVEQANSQHQPQPIQDNPMPPNLNQSNLRSDAPQNSRYDATLNDSYPQSYQPQQRANESYDRQPARPHSRSSATADPYYHDTRQDYDDRQYRRPHSRQGYGTDRGYSRSRYAGEYDEYYDRRTRKDDYYNYYSGRHRDYDYQGYSQYYQRNPQYDDSYRREDVYRAHDGNYYRSSDYYRRQYDSYGNYRADPYYQDYGQHSYRQRGTEEDDQRSMYSERSMHYNDPDRQPQQQPQAAADMYNESYQRGYNSQYYGEQSLNDTTYTNTYNEEAWENLPEVVPERRTPAKFSSAHPVARFGAGGHLIHVLPHVPAENQPAVVEIHKIETLLQNTNEAEEFRAFPGPLSKEETHKNDVLRFAGTQAAKCVRSTELMDRDSAALIWEFLGLLVRQNGAIQGTDVAELLMKDHSGNFGLLDSPNDAQKQQQTSSAQPSGDELNADTSEATLTGETSQNACSSFRFRELLLYGRKKDALEWAMKSNLWGHALLLASKTDARTHANVMLRFANSLPINDPLQTLYQQMSGRQPASATCIADEGWGDWRPHLAMILSNATNNVTHDTKIAMTMGDTLIAKGLLDAAHFCYLMASAPLGFYTRKTNKLVLLGSNQNMSFEEFAINEAIRRSETYEYAISLGSQSRHKAALLPPLQIFKFIYACRLMECGMVAEAFHYCELIAKLICRFPKAYSVTLVTQLSHIVDLLQNHDTRLQAGTLHTTDLQWIDVLHKISDQMLGGGMVSVTSYSPSESTSADERISSTRTSPLEQPESPRSDEVAESWAADGMVDTKANQYLQPHHHQINSETPQDFGSNAYGDVNNQQTLNYNQQQQTQVPTFYQQQPQDQIQISHGILQTTNPLTQPSIPTYDTSNNNNQTYQQPAHQQPVSGVTTYDVTGGNQQQPVEQPGGYYDQTQYQQPDPHGNQPFQPSHNQEPVKDYYDQMSAVRGVSRIRTTSQASHASHQSRASFHRQRLDSKRSRSSGQRSRTVSENSQRSRSRSASAESEKAAKKKKEPEKESKGWFFGLWGGNKKKTNSHKVHLPDDSKKEIVWDNEKKRWINMNEPEEERAPLQPPPMDMAGMGSPQTAPQPSGSVQPDGPNATLTPNRFSLKNMGGQRAMYKNAFGSSTTTSQDVAPPPMFPTMQSSSNPAMFVPKAVPTSAPQDGQPTQNQHHNEPSAEPTTHNQAPDAHSQQQPQFLQQPQNTQQQQQPPSNFYQPQQQASTNPQMPQQHQQPQMTQQHQQPQMPQQHQQQPQMPQQHQQPQMTQQHQQPQMTQQHQQPQMTQQHQQPPQPMFQPQPPSNSGQPNASESGLTGSTGGGAFVPVVPRSGQNQQTPSQEPTQAPPPGGATFFNPANFGGGNLFAQPAAPASSRGGMRGRGRPAYPAAR